MAENTPREPKPRGPVPPDRLPKEDRAPTQREANRMWRSRPAILLALVGALALAAAVTYGCNQPGTAEAGYVPIIGG